MTIHHLNCGTLHPPSQLLVNGRGSLTAPAILVCHCLVVQTGKYWTLVDAGLGSADLPQLPRSLGDTFLRRVRPALNPVEPAITQVQALGIDPHDVRSIVLTHHDVDHVGGIARLPLGRASTCHMLRSTSLFPHCARIWCADFIPFSGRIHRSGSLSPCRRRGARAPLSGSTTA